MLNINILRPLKHYLPKDLMNFGRRPWLFAISISFVVPKLYPAIAFDAGGVASGPMTATFLLPLAQGAWRRRLLDGGDQQAPHRGCDHHARGKARQRALHLSLIHICFSAVLQQQKRPDRLPSGGQADAAFTALQQRHAPFLLQIGEHL